MRGAITFSPIGYNDSVRDALNTNVQCLDCNALCRRAYAALHGWRTIETEVTPTQTTIHYLCPDCCEARVEEYNQAIIDQADDI